MFPSQRGTFFRKLEPTRNNNGTKIIRPKSSVVSRTTAQLPLVPTTAVGVNTNATANTKTSFSEEDRSVISFPATVSRPAVGTLTLPVVSRLLRSNASKPSEIPSDVPGLVLPSSLTPPSTIATSKTEHTLNPYISKFLTTSNFIQPLPSNWSNKRFNVIDPLSRYHHIPEEFGFESVTSPSKREICKGQGLDGLCTRLPTKTQQERLLVKKLCEEAVNRRKDTFAFYPRLYQNNRSESDSNFHAKNRKGIMCDFMLKFVEERQKMMEEQRGPLILPKKSVTDGNLEPGKQRYTPVYCIRGKTFLGKPSEKVAFPNTFSTLTEFHDPQEDEATGYMRFCTLVSMTGFDESEIFLRVVHDDCLVVDGVHVTKDENTKRAIGLRATSVYVDLPKGVYPERLRIGRSFDGVLVIQESWKF